MESSSDSESSCESDSGSDFDSSYIVKPVKSNPKNNTLSFENTVKGSVDVSPEKLGTIATNVLKDLSAIYPEVNPEIHSNMIVRRSKMRNQQNMVFKKLSSLPLKQTIAVGWDGKKSDTLVQERFHDNKLRNVKEKKEHIVITDIYNKVFIAEFSPAESDGQSIALGVLDCLEKKGIDISKVKFISGDSTPANTGFKGGCFAWFEELCSKTFNWVVCCSHLIELPLRKAAQSIIGETTGPGSFRRYHLLYSYLLYISRTIPINPSPS